MKALELSQEYRTKLLEMAKALFPQYDIVWGKGKWHENDYLWISEKESIISEIHWLELAACQLLVAIHGEDFKITGEEIIDQTYKDYQDLRK